jgi:hypothetical protein
MKLGFTSVMIDASDLPFEENIARTKEIVKIAHSIHSSRIHKILGLLGISINICFANLVIVWSASFATAQ